MSKFRNVVQQAIKQANTKDEITITAENDLLLVDDYKLDYILVYRTEALVKKLYPDMVEFIEYDAYGNITWDASPSWTGQGFKFTPQVRSLDLTVPCTIVYGDGTEEEVNTDIPVDMEKVKIEIESSEDDNCKLELKEVDIHCDTEEINIIFRK